MRCSYVKSSGSRCKVDFGLSEDGHCWHHDPAKAAARRRARERGGAVTASKSRKLKMRTALEDEVPAAPQTVEDAIAWASWAVTAVATGKIDARTGHEIGYVLRAFLDGRKHLDSVDTRVKALHETVKGLKAS
jgi:hypothetical protein